MVYHSYDVSLFLDTKKMPLGKLSKPQIAKGFEVRMLLLLT